MINSNSNKKKEIYLLIKNRGDLSYWDSMAGGGDRASKDFADKANVHVIETTGDVTANQNAMYEAIDKGANLIITAADFRDNVLKVSEEHPEVGFAMEGEDLSQKSDKVYSFAFKTSEASFLAGIVAADIASSKKPEGTSGNKTVGFIGGMDEVLVIQEFLIGYIQGAKFYDPQAKIVTNYVGGWNDPDTAKTQALTQYNDAKADVIFACAGGSGNGVHTAAAQAGKYVIGVDSNQALMYENDKNIQKRFATSVMKELGNAVYNSVKKYLNEGTLPYGKYEKLGLKEDAVSIVEDEVFQGLLSDNGKAKLQEAKDKISSGDIKVESALGKDQPTIKKFIEDNSK
jgi:basic membrane protein A